MTLTLQGSLIAAAGSGSGKTLVCAALARHHARAGRRVQVVKLGPDFLDPMVLALASGRPVYNLDWWMMGETHCRQLLYDIAGGCDVLLVESLLGLHDQSPSNAWLARQLGLPVTLLLNVATCRQTAGAIVHGLAAYDGGCDLRSVIGNRVADDGHHAQVAGAMPAGIHYRGSLQEHPSLALPVRHLGLVQEQELPSLSTQLDAAADYLLESGVDVSLPALILEPPPGTAAITAGGRACDDAGNSTRLPGHSGGWADRPLAMGEQVCAVARNGSRAPGHSGGCADRPLADRTIAVARDRVFSFIYAANIDTLLRLGATIRYFSPLNDDALPDCDALWLPGGYPELALAELAQATTSRASILGHIHAGKPGLAECGGMMYLGRTITDASGRRGAMCGAFEADFRLQTRFRSIGHQVLQWGGQRLHGHSFHHSCLQHGPRPDGHWQKRHGGPGEAVFVIGAVLASYGHLYFAQAPQAVARLFGGR